MISILVTVIGLGLLIAAHEAGHLLLARLMGMRVETYSLGFGPRLAGFKHGETDYRISALPLGGYCKIAGFTPDEAAAQDPNDTGSYMNKPAWRRALVIAAGPGVNWLVAFLLITTLYVTYGFTDLSTRRVAVIPGGPAAAAGMQTGDEMVAVDGVPIGSFTDLQRELHKDPVERRIDVLRKGAPLTLQVRPDHGRISVSQDRVLLRVPLAQAIPRAASDVWASSKQLLSGLADAVTFRGGAALSGPIGIVTQASAEVKRGLADFAAVLANISIGLAIFNFLPVPALDGGRLVFLGIELVTGRKVNQKFETAMHMIGLLLLLALVLGVTVFGDLHLGRKLFHRG
jgi:regulator of sigma E protease